MRFLKTKTGSTKRKKERKTDTRKGKIWDRTGRFYALLTACLLANYYSEISGQGIVFPQHSLGFGGWRKLVQVGYIERFLV